MKKNLSLIILSILFCPSLLFADAKFETGYDLYHNLKLIDDPQNIDQVLDGMSTLGYLQGCIDGLIIMQDLLFDRMLPKDYLTENERKEYAKKIMFYRLNAPEKGIPVGQMILIFNKYAENHPEKLDGTARICIIESLIKAYGWK